jgi:lantibiotic biosynthesis protein
MKFDSFGMAFIRTPAFPLSEYIKIAGNEEYLLKHFINSSFFRNGLFFASPELYYSLTKDMGSESQTAVTEKLKHSLLKYAMRATSRSTPFGIFAGIGTVTIADNTNIEIGDQSGFRLHSRLDVDFLCSVINDLSRNSPLKKYLLYYPNSTLYRLGNHYRTIETRYVNRRRKYELTSFEYNEYVELILTACRGGASIETMVNCIVSDSIDVLEAETFIDDLIESQVLISELEPSTTGIEIADQLQESIGRVMSRGLNEPDGRFALQVREQLCYFINTLKGYAQLDLTADRVPQYRQVIDSMKQIIPGLVERHAIQSDMKIAFNGQEVHRRIIGNIKKGISVLRRFTKKEPGKSLLDVFIEKFLDRYETREVPLIEALDVETGIGYGEYMENHGLEVSSLLAGLPFNKPSDNSGSIKWNRFHDFWSNKIIECMKTGATTVQLTEDDLDRFEDNESLALSDTFVAGTTLLKNKDNNEPVINLKFCGSATAALWTGRFCHIDEGIHALTREIANYEELVNEDAIVAEINHLPHDRLGNVLQRPVFRAFEIPYMAKSSVPPSNQLPLEDLLISVVDKKIVLRSKRLNKKVIPFLSNAHSYSFNTLPLYHFLADLQTRDRTSVFALDLDSCMQVFKFLPRIVFDNIILNGATWTIGRSDLEPILGAANVVEEFRRYCIKRSIPRYFLLSESDNQLLIDRDSDSCMELFISEIKNKAGLLINESWLNDYDFITKNSKGEAYNNEVMFCFKQEPVTSNVTNRLNNNDQPLVTRNFIPGTEWLYYKIYGGFKTNDEIIVKLHESLRSLTQQGIVNKWFFLRYFDPSAHLRVRIQLHNVQEVDRVLAPFTTLLNNYYNDGLIWKVSMDTYCREYERYGFGGMDNVESLFHYDSDACLQLLSFVKDTGNEDLRWMAALYAAESYMNLFGLSKEEKMSFSRAAKEGYGQSLGSFKLTKKVISKKYEANKGLIDHLMNGNAADDEMAEVIGLTNKQHETMRPYIEQVKIKAGNRYYEILSDLIHMNINRMTRAKNVAYEYVIYEFLENYYFRSRQKAAFANRR